MHIGRVTQCGPTPTRRGPARSARLGLSIVLCAALTLTACSLDSNDGAAAEDRDRLPSTTTTTTTPEPVARYAGFTSEVYSDPASWLCRPDTDDICDTGLDATVVEADGTLTEQPWVADPEAPVDCFYVYPTISRDPTQFSDRIASDSEEGFAALNQVARLGERCRVFAPIYRQRTLSGLVAALGSSSPATTGAPADGAPTTTAVPAEDGDGAPGFADVLDAWKQYMSTDNHGRGVVLIGHSQGAAMLNQLIQTEIDPNTDVRDRLVAAYLAGWAVAVPEGADVGGDFDQVPLCRTPDQLGCVVTWASFRSTAPPPPTSFFGRPRSRVGASACNTPAALDGGPGDAVSYFPSSPRASILSSLGSDTGSGTAWVDPAPEPITTPFVTTPGLVSVECVQRDGFSYQEVTVRGDPADPRVDDIGGDLTPEWGLHLQDVNLVMGNIVGLVASQSSAYLSQHG